MDRLDEEFEILGSREAPLLKGKPSEYMTSGQFFYAFELEESTLPYVVENIVDKSLMEKLDASGFIDQLYGGSAR